MGRLMDRVRAVLTLAGPLGAGTRVLLLRLVERFGWKVVGASAALTVYAAFRYRTWIVWMLLVWCAAAWMHAPGNDTEHAPEPEEEQPEEPPADPLPGILWRLIGNAPGAHIKTLTERLQKAAPEQPLDKAAVRAKLGALGIAVRPSVRDAAGKVNEGVHREDLKAWEEALYPAAPVSLFKARSSPVATAVTCGVADPPTAVATPATPVE